MVVLCDILLWLATLTPLALYLTFLIVSVYVVVLLKLIVTVLGVVGIAVHLLVLPNQVPEIHFKYGLLVVPLINLINNLELTLHLEIALIKITVKLKPIFEVVI